MAATTGGVQAGSTRGRRVSIAAFDGSGSPAGAIIEILIDGRGAGHMDLGTGSAGPISITVSDPNCVIQLTARFMGQTLVRELGPQQDEAVFRFSAITRFALARKPLAHCPDGSSGSPCAQCRDPVTGKTWESCC